jgi:hypothetical protein
MMVTIRRVSLASLAKFGCLLGAVAAFLPSLLCGLLGLGLAGLLHRWLEGWEEVDITLLGTEVARFDLVHMLGLNELLELLRLLTAASAPALILAVLILAVMGGIVLALIISLVGLAYNLLASVSGGLAFEMHALRERKDDSPDQSKPAP